jgi:NADH dehydrogenase FAD-containing subunit
MTVLKNLDNYVRQGHRVTLIGPSQHHYYSGMGPGVLSGIYKPQEVRFNVKKMAEDRGGSFVLGSVVRIDAESRNLFLSTGEEVKYDAVSFNVGSHVPADSLNVMENVFTVKPIENLLRARQIILNLASKTKPKIIVVGGGASGVEITGNIWRLLHDRGLTGQITLLAREKLLSRFPEKARHLAIESLVGREIEVLEGTSVSSFDQGLAHLEDGRQYPYELALLAWGIRPPDLFRRSGLPTGEDGGLLVNEYLQSVGHTEIFGGGDCISFQGHPLDRVGVHAVRQNPILYHNLHAALEGGKLQSFKPNDVYLLLFNLGNGKAIYWRNTQVWSGRLLFAFKNYLDKKFMRKFQVSGELDEHESSS